MSTHIIPKRPKDGRALSFPVKFNGEVIYLFFNQQGKPRVVKSQDRIVQRAFSTRTTARQRAWRKL